jgi:transketolase
VTPSTSLLPPADTGEWTELDRRVVDTARLLALDAVEKVGNGHPGTAMSLAPAVTLLFQRGCGPAARSARDRTTA